MKLYTKSLSAVAFLLSLSCLVLAGCTASDSVSSNMTAPGRGNAVASYAPGNKTTSQAGDLQLVKSLPAADNTNDGTDVPVAVGDLMEVSVFQVPDLTREVRVSGNGTISLPLIGTVKAAGLTLNQLKDSIESRYRQNYLQAPQVSVLIKESAGQRVTLEGAFEKPGIYPAEPNTTLLRSVALASGLSRVADERKLYVYRTVGGRKYVANYSLTDIRNGKQADPRIYGGDIVIAFQSKSKVAMKNLADALGIAVSATRVVSPF